MPDLKKVMQLASLFDVSTDYLLMDEMLPESDLPFVYGGKKTDTSIRMISMEEANDFLDMKQKEAPIIANAVAMCILSPVILVVLGALADANMFHMPNRNCDVPQDKFNTQILDLIRKDNKIST